jgi:hypothetical protein
VVINIARVVLTNVALVCGLLGATVLSAGADLSLYREGRLTELACYVLLAALVLGVAALVRVELLVRAGQLEESSLPAWLRDS